MWNLKAMAITTLSKYKYQKRNSLFSYFFWALPAFLNFQHTGRIPPTDFREKSWFSQRWCHGRSAWVHKDSDIQSLTGMASRQSLSEKPGVAALRWWNLTVPVGSLHVSAKLWVHSSCWVVSEPNIFQPWLFCAWWKTYLQPSTKCFSPGLAISPRTIVAVPLWPSRQRLSAPSRKGATSFVSLGRNSLDKETHLFCVFWTDFPNRFQFSGG